MGSSDRGKLPVVDDIAQNVRLLEAVLVSRGRGGRVSLQRRRRARDRGRAVSRLERQLPSLRSTFAGARFSSSRGVRSETFRRPAQ